MIFASKIPPKINVCQTYHMLGDILVMCYQRGCSLINNGEMSREATAEISQLRSGRKRGHWKSRPERTVACPIAPGVLPGHKFL